MPLAGTLVDGKYRLVRPVGQGASSVVYFAVGLDGQPYAVKIFPPELSGRADRELRAAGALEHPRIARVLARTEVQGRPGVVSHFARGRVLFERFGQRPALVHERKPYLLSLVHLLDALSFMHGRGLVHRDVKPENVVVDGDGSARLVDFDLSGPALEVFQEPVRVGTLAFQSPEAARAEPLSSESDLYGVGLLLYWGLHGEVPTAGGFLHSSGDRLEPLRAALMHEDRRERLSDAAEARRWLLSLA